MDEQQATSEEIAISVQGVRKMFRLPHEKHTSLKSAFVNFYKPRSYENQHALEDVTFNVKKGEFFGIVGRNGSGKSTLLKLLAGIYTPNSGNIQVNGSLAPFIELGVGFNAELTGRENVYLNGALLGFSHKEMDEMYHEIVQFAELERFMDQKLKNYSSGMQVRLAFSIAIKARADTILLDEVLAVGDANFQKKCFDYFNKVKKERRTVILVTHDMSSVERFCDRALILDKGKILNIGAPQEIAQEYSDLNLMLGGKDLAAAQQKKQAGERSKERKNDVSVDAGVYVGGKKASVVYAAEPKATIKATVKSKIKINNATFGIVVTNPNGLPVFATNTKATETKLNIAADKEVTLVFDVDNIFSNGEYAISVSIKSEEGTRIYYSKEDIARFLAGGRKHDYAFASPKYELNVE
jgi:ABC-2 type transport system ATP-binding protein